MDCQGSSQMQSRPGRKLQGVTSSNQEEISPPAQEHVLGGMREGCSQDSDEGLPGYRMETEAV